MHIISPPTHACHAPYPPPMYPVIRLSMLAFTAIVPIIYLTETYAKWSSQVQG